MFSSALRAQRFRALGGVRFHSMEHAIGAPELRQRSPAAPPVRVAPVRVALNEALRNYLTTSPPPAEATSQWKKYSYVFLPVVVVFGVVTMGKHFMHGHHDHDEVPFPYMKKRDKAMPWALKGGSKCDLFDYDCSAKERALKAGVEPAHH